MTLSNEEHRDFLEDKKFSKIQRILVPNLRKRKTLLSSVRNFAKIQTNPLTFHRENFECSQSFFFLN